MILSINARKCRNCKTDLPNTQGLTAYIGHTNRGTFSNSTDWEPISNLTQVYTGGIDVSGGVGWKTITLDTPFTYNGTDNLIISFDENQSGYDANSDEFHCTNVGAARTLFYRSDSNNPNPASPPPATFDPTNYIANIILNLESNCDFPEGTASFDCTTNEIILDVTKIGSPTGTYSATIDGQGAAQTINTTGTYPNFGPLTTDQSYNVVFDDGAGCRTTIPYVFGGCELPRTPAAGCTSLWSNSDFEAGATGWAESAKDGNNINVLSTSMFNSTLPLAGDNGVFFGGYGGSGLSTGGPYTSTMSRSFFGQLGKEYSLNIWLLLDACDSPADVFEITVDGTVVYTITEADGTCDDQKWRDISINLTAYADNVQHLVEFKLTENEANNSDTRVFMDEILLEECTSPCPANYPGLVGTAPDMSDYESNGSILSIQTIAAGTTVDYDSGTEITLGIIGAGFEVELGAVFCAFIDGCNGEGGAVDPLGEEEETTTLLEEEDLNPKEK